MHVSILRSSRNITPATEAPVLPSCPSPHFPEGTAVLASETVTGFAQLGGLRKGHHAVCTDTAFFRSMFRLDDASVVALCQFIFTVAWCPPVGLGLPFLFFLERPWTFGVFPFSDIQISGMWTFLYVFFGEHKMHFCWCVPASGSVVMAGACVSRMGVPHDRYRPRVLQVLADT